MMYDNVNNADNVIIVSVWLEMIMFISTLITPSIDSKLSSSSNLTMTMMLTTPMTMNIKLDVDEGDDENNDDENATLNNVTPINNFLIANITSWTTYNDPINSEAITFQWGRWLNLKKDLSGGAGTWDNKHQH